MGGGDAAASGLSPQGRAAGQARGASAASQDAKDGKSHGQARGGARVAREAGARPPD